VRFLLFGALYLATGMAAAQSAGYGAAGAALGVVTVAVLLVVMQASFGAFGGKT
jgi:hypothetical protein